MGRCHRYDLVKKKKESRKNRYQNCLKTCLIEFKETTDTNPSWGDMPAPQQMSLRTMWRSAGSDVISKTNFLKLMKAWWKRRAVRTHKENPIKEFHVKICLQKIPVGGGVK